MSIMEVWSQRIFTGALHREQDFLAGLCDREMLRSVVDQYFHKAFGQHGVQYRIVDPSRVFEPEPFKGCWVVRGQATMMFVDTRPVISSRSPLSDMANRFNDESYDLTPGSVIICPGNVLTYFKNPSHDFEAVYFQIAEPDVDEQ